ncbi:MAG: phosphohistidine phosphatase [Actinomycetota bacterium]|nr:phosphohistidine phosphatase [Actinomycetota bacterium]
MPTLVLLRHAKSAWPPGVPDLLRPLNDRGRKDAPAVGQLLAARAPLDLALVSPANRTQQTWDAVASELQRPPTAGLDPRIYEADVSDLLDVLAGVPAVSERVILVGHNPGTELLAQLLCTPSQHGSYQSMIEKFPTSGLAEIRWQGDWTEIAPNTAELVSFDVPRG